MSAKHTGYRTESAQYGSHNPTAYDLAVEYCLETLADVYSPGYGIPAMGAELLVPRFEDCDCIPTAFTDGNGFRWSLQSVSRERFSHPSGLRAHELVATFERVL